MSIERLILQRLRRLLLAIVAAGLIATAADLFLLAHYEDQLQLIPFGVIALALVALAWHALSAGRASLRALRGAMGLIIVTAAVGVFLHYRGNMEFQREMDPSIAGFALFKLVMQAKAPPALAPGNMALLGLVGLVSTYRSED